jgi:2-aminomuconate deaminase
VILHAAGAGLENLVDLTVFLVDMKDYKEFNEVYNTFFTNPHEGKSVISNGCMFQPLQPRLHRQHKLSHIHTGPSRTTVAVKQLPNPRLLIEIKAVALAPL